MKYEPTAADAARHVAITIARCGCSLIICACIAIAWIGSPA
jgi:hypothetical protein